MTIYQQRLLAVAAAALFGSAAHAGVVASRADLQAAIGGAGTTETFEGLPVSGGGAADFSCASGALSAGSSCGGVSTTSLAAGATYTSTGSFQVDGAGYYGAPSKELLSNSGSLGISFTGAVNAVGLDLRAFSGYGDHATITVYGTDGVTVLDTVTNFTLSGSGVPAFFGYESSAGIGGLSLSPTSYPWSPLVDNVEWGSTTSAVPEPTSLALMGLSLGLFALARRKRA